MSPNSKIFGTEFLKEMLLAAKASGVVLVDRELACAPINSEIGLRYLGAMRAAINCALANREIIGHYVRRVFAHFVPSCDLQLLFDVSHNTCKVEKHIVDGRERELYVHHKGATRAFGRGHASLPEALRPVGQPVLIGGSMRPMFWSARWRRKARHLHRRATVPDGHYLVMQPFGSGADARLSTLRRRVSRSKRGRPKGLCWQRAN